MALLAMSLRYFCPESTGNKALLAQPLHSQRFRFFPGTRKVSEDNKRLVNPCFSACLSRPMRMNRGKDTFVGLFLRL